MYSVLHICIYCMYVYVSIFHQRNFRNQIGKGQIQKANLNIPKVQNETFGKE